MKRSLADFAKIIRSKNAGPTLLTIDILFNTDEEFGLGLSSLTPNSVCQRYGCEIADLEIIPYQTALAIKIVLRRKIIAGSPGDRDVYGSQQHGPLLGILV